jgi:hypothetical protein
MILTLKAHRKMTLPGAYAGIYGRGGQEAGGAARVCTLTQAMGGGAHVWLADAVARLVRDYERRIDVSQSMIYIALGATLLRRIS